MAQETPVRPGTYAERVDALRAALHDAPITYLPALLTEVVKETYRRGVWQPGGASRFVAAMEGLNGTAAPEAAND